MATCLEATCEEQVLIAKVNYGYKPERVRDDINGRYERNVIMRAVMRYAKTKAGRRCVQKKKNPEK